MRKFELKRLRISSIHVSLIVWAIARKGTSTEESWDEDAFKLSCLDRDGEIKMAENFTRFGKKK